MAAADDVEVEESDDDFPTSGALGSNDVDVADGGQDAPDANVGANGDQEPPLQPQGAMDNGAQHFAWPYGMIPFTICERSFDTEVTLKIMSAIENIQRSTCLKFSFVEEHANMPYLNFTNDNGQQECDHNMYAHGGNSLSVPVILGYSCLQQHEIIHSILHGLGFNDEHQHPQRDYYINILWDNIIPSQRHMFRLMPFALVFSEVGYDYNSVMHLHSRKYTKNGKPTMSTIEPGRSIMPSENLSDGDKMKIDLYFGTECRRRDFTSMLKTCKTMFDWQGRAKNI